MSQLIQKLLADTSISNKYALIIVFSAIVLIAIGTKVYINLVSLSDSIEWVNHTNEVLIELEQLRSDLKDAETGQRGFLLTGTENYLDPYNNSITNSKEGFDKLKFLTSDNNNQQVRLDKLKPIIDAKYAELQETIDLRRQVGFEAALAVVKTDKGKEFMVQMRQLLKEMVDEELYLLEIRDGKAKDIEAETVNVLIYGIGGLLAFIFTFIFLISANIKRRMNSVISKITGISEGQISDEKIDDQAKDEVGTLAKAYNLMNSKLFELISQLEKIITDMSKTEESLRDFSGQLSGNSSQQAAGIEEITASLEEIVSTIDANSSNASETNSMAKESRNLAERGNESVGKALEAAQEISKEINVISEMARQTNLLSLNASVEAARAGEMGKGFAVVAGEVKKLAARSQESSTLIDEVVNKSLQVSQEAKSDLDKIVPKVEKTAQLVQSIVGASEEQGYGINQINESMLEMNKVSQANAQTSEQIVQTADKLSFNVEALEKSLRYFTVNGHRQAN